MVKLTTALLFVIGLATSLPGCFATPVPIPPDLSPPDVGRMEIEHAVITFLPTITGGVIGHPGCAEPNTMVWAANVGRLSIAAERPVAEDGSFVIPLYCEAGDVIRVQARNPEGSRSIPIDVLTGPISPAPPTMVQFEECLSFDPPYEIDFGIIPADESSTRTLTITNNCGSDLVVDTLGIQAVDPNFFAESALTPPTISDGESEIIELRFSPPAHSFIGPKEEILLINVTSPFVESRPFTLYGGVSAN